MKALTAIHEVQIVYKRPLLPSIRKIVTSRDANQLLKEHIDLNRIDLKEFFWVILLTRANQVLSISEVAVGSTSGVVVNYKEIFQLAILGNACGLIVAHNHPSGSLDPSKADINTTARLNKFSKLIDIKLLDHLILTSEGYTSLADEGFL